MKKLAILMLFLSYNMYSQITYTASKYCVDESPFQTEVGEKVVCELEGFEPNITVTFDESHNKISFFMIDLENDYFIVGIKKKEGWRDYYLENKYGTAIMKVRNDYQKIVFCYPSSRIYLTMKPQD